LVYSTPKSYSWLRNNAGGMPIPPTSPVGAKVHLSDFETKREPNQRKIKFNDPLFWSFPDGDSRDYQVRNIISLWYLTLQSYVNYLPLRQKYSTDHSFYLKAAIRVVWILMS
jgi:hypothetical protein